MNASAHRPLWGNLHALEIASPDPRGLAAFYQATLGMQVAQDEIGWSCRGPDRLLRFVQGERGRLSCAAYAVQDSEVLGGLKRRLTEAGVAFDIVANPDFVSDCVKFLDPDGNPFLFGLPRLTDDSLGGMAARLQHVVLASRNADRLSEFFQDVVGFRLSDRVNDDADVMRTVFLRSNHEHHSLAVFQASENRLDHHCYEAEDWNAIRDWGDHFASRRLPVEWGPGRHGPGNNLFIFVSDPDKNWLEISAELEIVEPDRPVGTWLHEERTLNSWGRGVLRT
jgi:catechol 2,3-dioxygenase-like lactoylglutathione lyase family enzyme